MATNQHINKVIYGGDTLIDLTGDTASAATVLSGATFHDKSGASVTGACTYDADTSDATAAVAEILVGKTAYANGAKITGTMPNNGSKALYIERSQQRVTIPMGFHDGSGFVAISTANVATLQPSTIKNGVTVLGITGTYTGKSDLKIQSKTATPTTEEQQIIPDADYDYLAQVTVSAIPYTETDNSAGGKTVTIAG